MLKIKLKEKREERGLTMRELAQRAGVSASVVCKIETMQVDAKFSTMFKICMALNIKIDDIIC